MITASLKTLNQVIPNEEAKLIRKIWKAETVKEILDLYPPAYELWQNPGGYTRMRFSALKRTCIDKVIDTFGVEFLGTLKRSDEDVYYCNAGDTYTGTIVFIGDRLVVNCWGHYVEKNLIGEFKQEIF